jgi:hypothetical protein
MRHSAFTAVYDACVLYPAPLRDFLMWLGMSNGSKAVAGKSRLSNVTMTLAAQRIAPLKHGDRLGREG